MIMAKIKSGKLKDSCCLEKGKIKLLHLLRYLLKTEVYECSNTIQIILMYYAGCPEKFKLRNIWFQNARFSCKLES